MINQKKLSLYLNNNLNVLLEGAHGVGKTAVVKEVFESANLNWKYYSAATMDPWVDFIGVPKTVSDVNGNEVLELVKPKDLAHDEVEALFFDEFNRAPSKVMNAVMELIQFKSINGKKFNNLKVVWAAINPFDEDGTYNVESIDPAILDRFHINIKVPYELDTGYLYKTYGAMSKPFVKWWNELPKDLKHKISPRRLDYAIKISTFSGDLNDVLPRESNVSKLYTLIRENQDALIIEKIMSLSAEEKEKFFTLENTHKFAEKILREPNGKDFIPHFNKEFIESRIQSRSNDPLTNTIVNTFLNDDGMLNIVSKNSIEVLEDIKKKRSEINRYAIPKQNYFAIQNMTNASLKYSVKTFLERMQSSFYDYMGHLKTKRSNDLPSYFEAVFMSKEDNGAPIQAKIIDLLATPFKNMSQSLPPDNLFFCGLMYNFAIKYADKVNRAKLEAIVEIIFLTSKKNRSNYNKSAEEFIYGFNESNWNDFRHNIWVARSIKSTQPFKDFALNHKNGSEKVFTIQTPSSIEDTIDFFCKKATPTLESNSDKNSNKPRRSSKKNDMDFDDIIDIYKDMGDVPDIVEDWNISPDEDDYDDPRYYKEPKKAIYK